MLSVSARFLAVLVYVLGVSLSHSVSADDETVFLPVDEAYQLEITRSDEGLLLTWQAAEGYFLYGDKFKFSVNNQAVDAEMSKGIVKYDKTFEKDVEKHYGSTTAFIPSAKLPDGSGIELKVRMQGCADAGLCYPPNTKYFIIDGTNISAISDKPGSGGFGGGGDLASASTADAVQAAPLLKLLAMIGFAMVGGMILNLMPCVLPVLSLKALSLTNSDANHRAQGWSYTFGAITTFFVIAGVLLIVRAAGQAVGWGFQLQSPGFVTVLVFLFFIMGLSLSGYITIGTQFMSVGQDLTQGNGLKQSYFTGVLASVVASPCTAPFMAPALGFALTQPWWGAMSIFIGLGFGMALPLLLLSYIPNLGRFLPAPGAWMDTFKQALAFPLYLTSIWLLWVLSRQLGANAAMLVVLCCLGIIFVYWLATKSASVTKIATVAAFVLAGLVTWNITKLEPMEAGTSSVVSDWEPYSAERLTELRSAGEPVFVNMTADWCITCKVNENVVFTDSNIEKMKSHNIHLIKGDWTNYDPEITKLLEQYDRGGVPLYLLFPAKTGEEPQVLPQILTQSMFDDAMSAFN